MFVDLSAVGTTFNSSIAAAYGWPADLTYEQILERLLASNLERAAEEAKPTDEELAEVRQKIEITQGAAREKGR